jgi:hypothetical protein
MDTFFKTGESPYVSVKMGIMRTFNWLHDQLPHHVKQRGKRQYTIQVNHLNYHSPVFQQL